MNFKSIINQKVLCKRNGKEGIVISEDNVSLTIQFDDGPKTVTRGTFQRWYSIAVAPEEPVNEPKIAPVAKEKANDGEQIEKGKVQMPQGIAGVGLDLRTRFLEIVKEMSNQTLDITYDEKNKKDIVKYNGRNVFECSHANKRFTVLCHPDSLTAENYKRATKVFPKEWGWALRAKFVFTELAQVPLMRTIITDGLFYRQREV